MLFISAFKLRIWGGFWLIQCRMYEHCSSTEIMKSGYNSFAVFSSFRKFYKCTILYFLSMKDKL